MTTKSSTQVTGYYLDLLARVHRELRPRTYLEIGMHTGDSLTLIEPETRAIGIDPVPSIRQQINSTAKLFFDTSDEFFEHVDPRVEFDGLDIDLAFIDGMHLFEFALRDFRNVERFCGPRSVVLMHDCYPKSAEHASRHRQTREWTGDTWKLVLCLKEYRPDLLVNTIRVGGSGMSVIRGFHRNETPTALDTRYDEILDKYINLDFTQIEANKDEALNAVPNTWDTVRSLLPEGVFLPPDAQAAARRRRVNLPIVTHQAKRVAKILLANTLRRRTA